MDNSKKFLEYFNKIDERLRSLSDSDQRKSFATVVTQLSSKNSIVRHFESDLKDLNNLRNVIVHKNSDEIIAEPNLVALREIEKIYNKLYQPKKIVNLNLNKPETIDKSKTMFDAFEIMRKNDYSQIPVVDDERYVGMFNSNVLLNYRLADIDSSGMLIENITLEEILSTTKKEFHVEFVSKEQSIFDLKEIYIKNLENEYKLDCILVTHSGSESEKLLGIITQWDLPNIYQMINE